jgi:hypothetical protein
VAPRTPADYRGRVGPKVVPNDTDQLDLDEKADRHRVLEEPAHSTPAPRGTGGSCGARHTSLSKTRSRFRLSGRRAPR